MILLIAVASAYAEKAITVTLPENLTSGTDAACESFHTYIDNLFTKYETVIINNTGWIPFAQKRITKSEWREWIELRDTEEGYLALHAEEKGDSDE
jgi:hypothetical protein